MAPRSVCPWQVFSDKYNIGGKARVVCNKVFRCAIPYSQILDLAKMACKREKHLLIILEPSDEEISL